MKNVTKSTVSCKFNFSCTAFSTIALLHSTKPELKFCAGLNPSRGVEVYDDEILWKQSRPETMLNAFHRPTIYHYQHHFRHHYHRHHHQLLTDIYCLLRYLLYSNVFHINFEMVNLDSTLLNVVNSDVDARNIVSMLI